jgi:hypothetical protein
MTRRKNPESTGFYIALAAAGVALYYLMSPKAAAKPGVGDNPFGPPDGGPPSPPSPPSTPPDGALPAGFMPDVEARQFQTNINTLLNRFGEPTIAVDGKFGPLTYAAWVRIRDAVSQIVAAITRSGIVADYDFLSDRYLFSHPNTGSPTFRLYNTQDTVALSQKQIDQLCRKPISLSAADLQALR